LTGHLKLKVARGNQSIFSAYTFKYLDTYDLLKLLQLSKTHRRELLASNEKVFVSHVYCGRISQMQSRISEWSDRNTELNRQLGLFEAKDKARNSLL